MVSKKRTERISERIREELSEMMLYVITDPRLEWVTITDVNVDRELAFANIFVSSIEGSGRREEILEGLEHAKGFIRRELARRVEMRVMPQLRFHWDPTPERADRIEKLIASLQDPSQAEEEDEADG